MSGRETEPTPVEPAGLNRLGYGGPLVDTPTVRWEDGRRVEQRERIVEETPVAIVYNRIPHVVMMATPTDLEDFALGFSLTEELIGAPADLEHIEIERYSRGVEIQATGRRAMRGGDRRADPAAHRAHRLRHLRRRQRRRRAQADPPGAARRHRSGRGGPAGARGAGRQPAAQRGERRGARRGLGRS